MSLSLCMIVKNEEKVLERCLLSTKNLFDEIVIVDTGSTDNTKQIAQKFTTKIYDYVWCDNFSKARNFAFSKATCSYIMWLDADDVMPEKTVNKLINLKQNFTADTYMLKYDIAFTENKPTFSYFRERIVKNCQQAKWQGVVHECIIPFGKIEKLNLSIEHHKVNKSAKISTRNLKIYQKNAKIRELSAREQYYYGRELFDHQKYYKCIYTLKKFISNPNSWVENVIDAHFLIAKCYETLKQPVKQFYHLTQTFKHDSPRANICCALGDYFLNLNQFQTALHWYNTATNCPDISLKGAFVQSIYYNYYPYLQMCVCHFNLGNLMEAEKCNKKAKEYYYSPAVKYNEKYFNSLKINANY